MKRLLMGIVAAGVAVAQPSPAPAPMPAPMPPAMAPMAPMAPMARSFYSDRDANAYRRGTRSLDERKYDDAVKAFTAVIDNKQSRADGALYWRAYAFNKQGKRTDAIASLDQLEKEYPSSAWLNDAKALRLEVRQSSGQAVSPESQSDDELKLLALHGIMRSDPERALPLVDKVLTSPNASPKVKEQALFVLAQSKNPKALETILKIARGGGNPDLQVKAIEYLGLFGARAEVAQLYSPNASPQVKDAVINSLMLSKNIDKLVEIARTDSDPRYRREAIERLGVMRNEKTPEILRSLYGGDVNTKRAVIDALFISRDTHQLVELARKEADPKLKKEIVERLSMMKDKEATDYMLELLK